MNKALQQLNERYEAMMFAKTPELGRKAARELVRLCVSAAAACVPPVIRKSRFGLRTSLSS